MKGKQPLKTWKEDTAQGHTQSSSHVTHFGAALASWQETYLRKLKTLMNFEIWDKFMFVMFVCYANLWISMQHYAM